MFPYLRLGPFLVQSSSLALLAGVWAAISLAEREAVRLKINPSTLSNVIFYGLMAGVVGARLGHALEFPGIYLASPLSLLALTPTTLSPSMGLLIGVITASVLIQRQQLSLHPTLDAFAPGLAFFMVSIGIANILSGDAYGAPATVPWAINLWGEYRHPSQVYEILAALAIFFVIWKRLPQPSGSGLNFVLVIFLSAAARVFLEAFRGDSVIWPGGFRAAQVIGIAVMAVAFWTIRLWAQPHTDATTASQEN